MVALRGFPGDYDNWSAHGAVCWAWEDVLPYFRLLERDRDFDNRLHGRDGRVPARWHLPEDWPPFSNAVGHTMDRAGFRYVGDLNGDFSDGSGPLPLGSTLSAACRQFRATWTPRPAAGRTSQFAATRGKVTFVLPDANVMPDVRFRRVWTLDGSLRDFGAPSS